MVAIRKLLDDSANAGYETRLANLEKAMELQSALNESIDEQLKIVQVLLNRVQRALKILLVTVIATAMIALAALALALIALNG
jgi:uncharacterized coiled-coil protein SlyX